MTSVQTELRSTRLCAELNTASTSSYTPHEASLPTPPPELMTMLGGRFAADVADILQKIPEKQSATMCRTPQITPKTVNKEILEHQHLL